MRARHLLVLVLATILGGTFLACQGASPAAADPPPVPLTIRAMVPAGPSGTLEHALRIALVWSPVKRGAGPWEVSHTAAEEIGVATTFPVHVQLKVVHAPPPEAFCTGSPETCDTNTSTGTLVVYEDVNENGKLDLVSDDPATEIDRVRGLTRTAVISYEHVGFQKDGGPAPGGFFVGDPGYTSAGDFTILDPACVTTPCPPAAASAAPPRGADGEVVIPLDATERDEHAICERWRMPSFGSLTVSTDAQGDTSVRPSGDMGRCVVPPAPGAGFRCNNADWMAYATFPTPLPTCDWSGVTICTVGRANQVYPPWWPDACRLPD